MKEPNWKNRTLFHGDNLDFMRAMNSESVDLIATDPPFNKGKDFHATPDSLGQRASFQDRWSWEEDVHEDWVSQLSEDRWRKVWEVINSTRNSYGDDMGAYLCFMAVRLIAMKRLLKPTGSIYLHCDPTASHYLKMLMDAIFGRKNFRNEIIWQYKTGGSSKRWFGRKHDILLFYSTSQTYTFNLLKEKSYLSHKYGFSNIQLFEDDKGTYSLVGMRDVWDIPALRGNQPETVGYPTQKPLALYNRIIEASSNEGDVVFDPFCGCATTCVAAEKLNRQWIGIDIWDESSDIVIDRLEQEGIIAPKYTKKTPAARQQYLWAKELYFTKRLPKRTDAGETDVDYLETVESFSKEAWERLSRPAMTKHLEKAQGVEEYRVICGGCGRDLEVEFMELDHIQPKADGGADDITNRILLCGPCNRRKRNLLALGGLVRENKSVGWMYDERAAKNAQIRARNYAQKLKRGQISLREGVN